MESLPEWLEEARFLRKFVIDGVSQNLLLRCLQGGQEWQKIKRITRFDTYQYGEGGQRFYIHCMRSPFSFDSNLPLKDDDEITDKVGGRRSSSNANVALSDGGQGFYIQYARSPFFFDINLPLNGDDEIPDKAGGSSSNNTTGTEDREMG